MKKVAAVLLAAAALPGLIYAPSLAAAGPQRKASVKKTPPAAKPDAAARAEAKLLLARAPSAREFPNAAHATLLDYSEIRVRPNGTTRAVTRQTVKVFNERGRDEAEVRIPYNSAFETVTVTRARTIKPNGQIVAVKPADVRDQGYNEGDGTYSDARLKSFSLPAVDDGCVLDYEYVTDQKASQMPGHFWTQWWFQGGSEPVLESTLVVTLPKGMALKQDLKNIDIKPVVTPSADGKTVRYVWSAKRPAPIEAEPLMPGAERVAPSLTLSTLGSWQDVARWYHGLAEKRMIADPTVKAQTQALIKGKATAEEKAKAIFYWVEEKTRYVALEFGMAAYQPRPAGDVCRNQYGDCKDMTTLLVAMLREAGVTAYPVLLNAGSQEKTSAKLPTPGAFNHAICVAEIGGRKFWLDATAQICPWGVIPGGIRGAETLVVRDNGVGAWETVPFAAPADNRMEQQVRLALGEDGSAKGTVRVTGTGDVDMGLRGALTFLRPDKVKEFVERMAQSLGANARVTNYQVSDFRNKDLPVTITYDVALPSWANKSGGLLLFKARAEQTGTAAASPFLRDTREHPILQPASALGTSTLEIALPNGFSVLSLPEAVNLDGELGLYRRTVEHKNNVLRITTRAENRRGDLPASRYDEVRKYFGDLLKAADETVVVKKG